MVARLFQSKQQAQEKDKPRQLSFPAIRWWHGVVERIPPCICLISSNNFCTCCAYIIIAGAWLLK